MPQLRQAQVLFQEMLAERTYRLRLVCPEIAQLICPGQFVMLRLPATNDPLLGRPFALYDTWCDVNGSCQGLDIVYLVVGRQTERLSKLTAGSQLEMWGPLGQPFPNFDGVDQVVLVAGGIGQTPFPAYIRWLTGQHGYGGVPPRRQVRKVILYYGVRTAQRIAGLQDFHAAGAEVRLASDDGTIGWKGSIVARLAAERPEGPLVGCGPEAMLRALAQLAQQWQRICFVSLETPMACGIGACFSCVTRIRTLNGWDYRRVCVDGPTFDAAQWYDAHCESTVDHSSMFTSN
jgi:dihydroorotate dehydrogenase electron transfer subunit